MAILKSVGGDAFFNVPDEQVENFLIASDKLDEVLKEAGIKRGVSFDDAELEKGDEVVEASAAESDDSGADATASYLYRSVVTCPRCYRAFRVVLSSRRYRYFRCACGQRFRA
mgnify:CR=1 FL=1